MRYTLDELMKRTKKAITEHQLIADDSNIMVGLSGGKDSLTLLWLLKQFQPISKYKYQLAAGHVSLGFPTDNLRPMQDFCQTLGVPFYHEPSQIGPIVFEARKESNPCALCAKMRRGALNGLAKANGFNKIALGHHQDDVLETTLLKMFFEGRIGSFNPITYLDRQQLTVIRPLVYVPESLIQWFANKQALPIVKSCCPANGQTKRTEMKNVLQTISLMSPGAKDRAIGALNKQFGSYWDGIPRENQQPLLPEKIMVSSCLVGHNCKYNGGNNKNKAVLDYLKGKPYLNFCPEVLGGLPIPRLPMEIAHGTGQDVLEHHATVINQQGEDFTAQFLLGAEKACHLAKKCKVTTAIMQERSPSCGVHAIYDGTFSGSKKNNACGVTAAALQNMGIEIFSDEEIAQLASPATPQQANTDSDKE